MQVETYEIEDASSEASQLANDAAALELIEQLNLTGQKEQSNKNTLSRSPYREMLQEEHIVFKALFDRSCPVEQYKAGIIPLRVLQVIAHAKQLGLYRKLEVWYPRTARVDDPVLVGFVGPNDYTGEWYLLARWGKALLPFEQLKKEAMELLRAERIEAAKEVIGKCEELLKRLPNMSTLKALSDRVYLNNI